MKTKIKVRGFGPHEIKILQKLGRRKKPFALGPLPGLWFLTDLRWETNQEIYPPFSYTAEFIQLMEVAKPKKGKQRG